MSWSFRLLKHKRLAYSCIGYFHTCRLVHGGPFVGGPSLRPYLSALSRCFHNLINRDPDRSVRVANRLDTAIIEPTVDGPATNSSAVSGLFDRKMARLQIPDARILGIHFD